jgi:hypothetical protein
MTVDPLALVTGELDVLEQPVDAGILVDAVVALHLGAQGIGRRGRMVEDHGLLTSDTFRENIKKCPAGCFAFVRRSIV